VAQKWRFGFAIADIVGADGIAQRDRPLVPDACLVKGDLSRLFPRTPDAFRAQCGDGEADVPKRTLIEYVKKNLPEADVGGKDGGKAKPLERGEVHG
jgi:hypothetical protein